MSSTPKPSPVKYVIAEGFGVVEIDKEYRDLGVKEGWLTFTGYYKLNGIVYFTYSN